MRKSKTLFDFFSKSPVNKPAKQSPSRQSNGDTKSSSSGKTSPLVSCDEKASKSQNDIPSFKNVGTKSPLALPVSESDKEKKPVITKSTVLSRKKKIGSSAGESDDGSSESLMETENKEMVTPKQVKRRRIIIASESEDSADEYKPRKEDESSDSLSESSETSYSESPQKKKKKVADVCNSTPSFDVYKYQKKSPNSSINLTPKSSTSCISSPASSFRQTPRQNDSVNSSFKTGCAVSEKFQYQHYTLDWLMPENIKDKAGRRPSHPDYNPETLYVPESFKKTLTPAMKQWWDLKSDNFDTILFFKVGKFYELYHMDAVVTVKELNLTYMKGHFAHSGFPEVSFGKFSDVLINKGYKVARIEQTETPQMMEQRLKKMKGCTKYDKVVKRELCQVTSKGTRTLSHEEWSKNIEASSNFLLAICEKRVEEDSSGAEYGICFVDTTIGKFTLGQFIDDRHQSRLLSLIAMYPPIEVLYDKASVLQRTLKVFDYNLRGVSKQALSSKSVWDAVKTLKFMSDSGYFNSDGDDIKWPKAILQMLDKDDRLYQTPLKEYELAFKALGAAICYLQKCCIDDCLLTMKLFEVYKPIDEISAPLSISRKICKHMILDNATLHNLAIVPTKASIKSEQTLFGTLNYCETSFGKRELRKWLCSPLYCPEDIYDRLNATDDLLNIFDVVLEARKCLRKLPDLERLLSKIHVHGLTRNKEHPESRAIFYEMEIYNKRKIADLLSALDGFKGAAQVSALFEDHVSNFKSDVLKKCISTAQGIGDFPQMKEILLYFAQAFDHDEAVKQGSIIPRPGVDDNYDSACKDMEDNLEALNSYRNAQSRKLNCQIKFVNVGKNRYLLEVPDDRKIPSEYECLSGRKGFKRFYTKQLKQILSDFTTAEEARDSAIRDTSRKMFEQFDNHYTIWQRAVQCLSTLDVLISLANYYNLTDRKACRPQFITPESDIEPFLEIVDGKHPTLSKCYTGKDYIPNSVYIGKKKETDKDINKGGNVILITGPNMGGKSTLMRQTGTLLVMAHLGCYVPAESMILTPVDRIFTRVGANDQIFKGESTFFVESSETASILHHATHDSFVLIDELGRGTATYDGTAIAYATAHYLANNIGCRTLFSTHYHSLVEDFVNNPNVGLGHMACMVEEDRDCPTLEKVTFLYKFADGACHKSYGFNVATLAGISKKVVRQGFIKAQQIDYGTKISKCLRRLLAVKNPEDIINELSKKISTLNM